MQFKEIIEPLLDGKKVRKKHWDKDEYIYLETGKRRLIDEKENRYTVYGTDLESNDWEIIKEETNVDIFMQMIAGTIFVDKFWLNNDGIIVDRFYTKEIARNYWKRPYNEGKDEVE